MGCDIHYVVERKVEKKWIGLYTADICRDFKAKERNYRFFAELAGVRGDSKRGREPLGMPHDPSELSFMCLKRWDNDAHSISWTTLKDFCEIFHETDYREDKTQRKEFVSCDALGIDSDYDNENWMDEYRVVFWFDN